MTFIDELNSIAVCGGKTFYSTNSKEEVLGDFFLLSLRNMLWIKVLVPEPFRLRRYGFFLGCNNGNLLIFGGLGEKNFIDGNVVEYELSLED